MKRIAWLCLFAFWAVLAVGCAPSLDPTQASSMPDEIKVKEIKGNWLTITDKDGNKEVVVNASRKDDWTYFSFGTKLDDPSKEPASWDLGFRRYFIMANSGVSGKGSVQVAILKGDDYDEIKNAPKEGYLSDVKDGDDPDEEPDFVFNLLNREWYVYNLREHVLKPRKNHVYIVKTGEDYYKIKMLGYYDKNGNAGFTAFKYAKIEPPAAE